MLSLGCEMRVVLAAVDTQNPSGPYEIRHCNRPDHNHEPDPLLALPGHRKRTRTDDVEDIVAQQTSIGVPRKKILASIKAKYPDALVLSKDIGNVAQQQKLLKLQSRTKTEQLFDLLEQHQFKYFYDISEDGAIKYIMFFFPDAIKQYQAHPDILGFDCTYSTNRYSLPLLNIVGATAQNTTIQFGVALLSGETEEDFNRPLQDLRTFLEDLQVRPRVIVTDRCLAFLHAVYRKFEDTPTLICQWHMNKDVLAYARKRGEGWGQVFDQNESTFKDSDTTMSFMEAYYKAINSLTETEFNQAADEIELKFPSMAAYLDKEWWPYRTRYVRAWTNEYAHFGEQTTSRIEGSHHSLKAWIETSQLDILSLFQQLLNFWTIQKDSYVKVMAESRTTPFQLTGPFWQSVVRVIHTYALFETRKIWSEVQQAIKENKQLGDCTGQYQKIYEMPCKHTVRKMVEEPLALLPSHYDQHWWITRRSNGPSASFAPRVREPFKRPARQSNRRVTHQRGHGRNSVRREHLHSEVVDANVNTAPPPVAARSQSQATSFNQQPSQQQHQQQQQLTPVAASPRSQASPHQQPLQQQQPPVSDPYFRAFLPSRSFGWAGNRPY